MKKTSRWSDNCTHNLLACISRGRDGKVRTSVSFSNEEDFRHAMPFFLLLLLLPLPCGMLLLPLPFF
jgi:hypothetical protein